MNSLEQLRFLVRHADELEPNGIMRPEQRVAAQHRLNTAIWE